MTVVFVGDVVGEAGRHALKRALPILRERFHPDFVVVNGENCAGGNGITPRLAIELMRYGVDVITLGDHVWDQKEIIPFFETEPRLLRPFNYPGPTPGRGYAVVVGNGKKLAVVCAQGRTFMRMELENPFTHITPIIQEITKETRCILVDFHAEATSEKVAFGHAVDGLVSAVIGTHTHIPTADAEILPQGTAYQTDSGMCGPYHSVIGRDIQSVVERYKTLLPGKWHISRKDLRCCGAAIGIDESTGRATRIESFMIRCGDLVDEENSSHP